MIETILETYQDQFISVVTGESEVLDHAKFYDELYDYFVDSGIMSYVDSADPYNWIDEKLTEHFLKTTLTYWR